MQVLRDFEANLSEKPYVSRDLTRLTIRDKSHAANFAYIQPNHAHKITWLVFDIDKGEQSFYAYENANLPPPNIVCQNNDNANCHILYRLEQPVWTHANAGTKAQDYLKAIKIALTARIGADPAYTGLICKNPLNAEWRVFETNDQSFTLDYLAEFARLKWDVSSRIDTDAQAANSILGRNCSLFDQLRFFSYPKVNDYRELKIGRAYDMWLKAVESEAMAINSCFSEPLPFSEIRATAKSVAKWTWNNYKPSEQKQRGVMGYGETRHNFNFSALYLPEEVKRQRQQEGVKHSHEVRKAETEAKITAAIAELKAKNLKISKSAVAKMTGLDLNNLSKNYPHLF